MYIEKDFKHLIGINGFSDKAMETHLKLYSGYVTNTNTLLEKLKSLKSGPEYNELKRRFGWEYNGMRLHELYFENLTKNVEDNSLAPTLVSQIEEDFSSFDKWREDFENTIKVRGIGWAVLAYDGLSQKLFNLWVNEHDLGVLAGMQIILIVDVFEHSYILDYGIDRVSFTQNVMKSIDWSVVEKRFKDSRV